MSNMSYCRFRNTLGDLIDCQENIRNKIDNKDEHAARVELIETCREIAAEFEDSDLKDSEFNEVDLENEEDDDEAA